MSEQPAAAPSYYLSRAGKKLDLREVDEFGEIAREVVAEGRTSMDYDRLYTLWQAARATPEGTSVVEVGSYRGGSAKLIAETLRRAGRAPRFWVCDTFSGHPRTDPVLDAVHHGTGKFTDASADETAAYLSRYPNVELLVGDIFDTSAALAAETFGLVHVDVDVYPATDFCLRFFAPRLGRGGVVVVDDYGVVTCPGVMRAADDFAGECPGFRLFHLLTGQALVYRT